MRKLAFECDMPAAIFNDSGSTVGRIKLMLDTIRKQLSDERKVTGNIHIAILVRCDEESIVADAVQSELSTH